MESAAGSVSKKAGDAAQPLAKGGAFKLVIGKRYLLLIAFLLIVSNLVNSTGEFILGKALTQEAQQLDSTPPGTPTEERPQPTAPEQKTKKHEILSRAFMAIFSLRST